MLSDAEEEENEVIKVSDLVSKFESEIRKQTKNEKLIHTVRQVLRESRKVQHHPLQRQESDDRPEFIISTADVKPGPDQDLSACTDRPRVKTRVLQHNRFTQLKEKCSEIITKNVRNKSKPLQHIPSPPRPNSFSNHTGPLPLRKTNSLPERRATYHHNSRQAKTYELKDVNDIGEGFEIIDIDDCVSGDEGNHRHRTSPQVEPLDLSEKNRSVESLDSGCDIETPRANKASRFQRLISADENSTEQQRRSRREVVTPTRVLYKKSVSVESGDRETGISVVCNIEVISDHESETIPEHPEMMPPRDTPRDTPRDVSHDNERHSNSCHKQEERQQSGESETDEEEPPLQFSEIFKLFEPSKRDGEEADRYAQHLRNKLAWKLASERVLTSEQSGSKEGSLETSSQLLNNFHDETLADRTNKKQSKIRPECPEYHDPELEDFISRCFAITKSIHDGLIGDNNPNEDTESEESLVSCFVPKMLVLPELSDLECGSVDSASLDGSMSWSDGEFLDVND